MTEYIKPLVWKWEDENDNRSGNRPTAGSRFEQKLPKGKICGFRKFDKVKYLRKEYFVKGRMSSGYAILMDIEENKVNFSQMPKGWKTPKLAKCKRVSARKSQMIFRKCL